MIKFVHKLTGTEMWVADARKDEYLAAGHKLAANTLEPNITEERTEETEAATKKVARKTSKKK